MSDVGSGAETEGDSGADLNEALKRGLRRAGMHWMRAGYEVLAGIGALLDELASAGDGGEGEDETVGPTKINLD